MTFSLYGLRDFEVQYWTGTAWLPVPGGTITNNTLVWRQAHLRARDHDEDPHLGHGGAQYLEPHRGSRSLHGTGAGNSPPTVTLTAPANGATYSAGARLPWRPTPATSDGTVSSVAFYANGALLGTDTTSPYHLELAERRRRHVRLDGGRHRQ